MIPTTGVWWDLNSCPVPDGFDPRRVRRSIESALSKYVKSPCPVTIFAVGNLEYVSPKLLKTISSSGILIRHTIFRRTSVGILLIHWERKNPPPGKILLISGDITWVNPLCVEEEDGDYYRILRTFPKDGRPSSDNPYAYGHGCDPYACDKEWVWEKLLKENSRDVVKSMPMRDEDEPAWFCQVCKKSYRNDRDFTKHFKGRRHKRNLHDFSLVDKNGKPFMFCELCEYAGYDDHNMKIHLKSCEHQEKLFKLNFVDSCPFCQYTGYDMANHYNSEEHTQKELDVIVAMADIRHAAAAAAEEEEEEDCKRSRQEDWKSRKRSRQEDCKSRKRSR